MIAPWESEPYCLVSWWDVIQFSAKAVMEIGINLERLSTESLVNSMTIPGNVPIFNPAKPLDMTSVSRLHQFLDGGEAGCRRLGLTISADTIAELRQLLKQKGLTRNCQWLKDQIAMLQGLIQKEMDGKVFLHIPPEKAKFFALTAKPFLFGKEVHDNFPSAYYDICESGACLATARPTASVFHSMRVLEIGLSVLGAVFGVSLAHTNWEPAIREIESKIREMHKDPAWKALPDYKEKQETYAQAASHFGILKDAWRNYTMHVRGKYTEEEAENIHRNLGSFMKKLTAIGLREQP